METLVRLAILEVWLIWFGLAGVFATGVLNGSILMNGLFKKKEGDRSFSPERVQLLLTTLATAGQYLAQVLKQPTHLPDVNQNWLALLGGSHALYLGRRFFLAHKDQQK